ncbi:hypothetical protein DXV38_04425 [Escherichia albertii]|nr:hypothetical protein [Escherichia albertii]PFF94643.1 hypothetical protein CRH02_18730 [Escherichia albertii]
MRSIIVSKCHKKDFAFYDGFRKLKSRLSGLIFAVTLKSSAAGTIFHSIGQMTISRKQDRGYVQAVEKKPGCNPHCCHDYRSGSPGVCR